jgi:hypothetical protein
MAKFKPGIPFWGFSWESVESARMRQVLWSQSVEREETLVANNIQRAHVGVEPR